MRKSNSILDRDSDDYYRYAIEDQRPGKIDPPMERLQLQDEDPTKAANFPSHRNRSGPPPSRPSRLWNAPSDAQTAGASRPRNPHPPQSPTNPSSHSRTQDSRRKTPQRNDHSQSSSKRPDIPSQSSRRRRERTHNPVDIIFGTAGIRALTIAQVNEELRILRQYDVKELDTARMESGSEATLGERIASTEFVIHTKSPGFSSGSLSESSLSQAMKNSLAALTDPSVETYFLQSPDPDTSIEETLKAVHEQYRKGKFKKFGLSNFRASDVKIIHELATKKGYIVPTIYQGNYNPVSRHCESDLIPLLRSLNMSFWAYSPLAGGFLAKTPQEIRDGNKGRWDKNTDIGKRYHAMYSKPTLISALDRWEAAAESIGTTKASLAYRWVRYNSKLEGARGDRIIIGASSPGQLKETLKGLRKKSLDASILPEIDSIWESVKDEAPVDNYDTYRFQQ